MFNIYSVDIEFERIFGHKLKHKQEKHPTKE